MENMNIDPGLAAYVDKIFAGMSKSPNMVKVITLVKVKAQQKYETAVGQGYSPNQAATLVTEWLGKFKLVLSQVGKTNTDGSVVNPNAASDMSNMLKEEAAPAAPVAPAPVYTQPVEPAYAPPAEEAVYAEPVVEEVIEAEPAPADDIVDASSVIDDYSPIPAKVKVVDSKKKAKKEEKAAKAEKPAKVKAAKAEKPAKPAKEKAEKPAKASGGKGGKIAGFAVAFILLAAGLFALYTYLIAPLLG